MAESASRGVRNNNPGNIRRGPTQWAGLAKDQPDPSFCTFTGPEWGIRAMAILFRAYQVKYGLHTVRQIINRWAPPSENVTSAYVAYVAGHMGVEPDDPVNVDQPDVMRKLVVAVIAYENAGFAYPADTVTAGLKLAGFEAGLDMATSAHVYPPDADELNARELRRIMGTDRAAE